jgi:hypothetical protein
MRLLIFLLGILVGFFLCIVAISLIELLRTEGILSRPKTSLPRLREGLLLRKIEKRTADPEPRESMRHVKENSDLITS